MKRQKEKLPEFVHQLIILIKSMKAREMLHHFGFYVDECYVVLCVRWVPRSYIRKIAATFDIASIIHDDEFIKISIDKHEKNTVEAILTDIYLYAKI